jgi:hypothetical protein
MLPSRPQLNVGVTCNMQEMNRDLSSGSAVLVGSLVVNVPVFAFFCGPAFAASRLGYERWFLYIFGASFFIAWGWWSFSLPRWRLWAYERVKSTGEVHSSALAVGLVWPRGSLSERTELRTAVMRQRQHELERDFP